MAFAGSPPLLCQLRAGHDMMAHMANPLAFKPRVWRSLFPSPMCATRGTGNLEVGTPKMPSTFGLPAHRSCRSLGASCGVQQQFSTA